jgi:hypothetical protein
MTQHNIGDRFQFSTDGKYDIILGYDGYGLQEVATGRNPLWWDADNFIGGFDTLEEAIRATQILDDYNLTDERSWAFLGDDLKQDLFSLKGL